MLTSSPNTKTCLRYQPLPTSSLTAPRQNKNGILDASGHKHSMAKHAAVPVSVPLGWLQQAVRITLSA